MALLGKKNMAILHDLNRKRKAKVASISKSVNETQIEVKRRLRLLKGRGFIKEVKSDGSGGQTWTLTPAGKELCGRHN